MTGSSVVCPTGARTGETSSPCLYRWPMAYVGNLTCRDCGLTFTSRWGSYDRADEFRCFDDHVVHAETTTGTVLTIDGAPVKRGTLADLRGKCPACGTELRSGLLPRCPVCGGRDHEVLLSGDLC